MINEIKFLNENLYSYQIEAKKTYTSLGERVIEAFSHLLVCPFQSTKKYVQMSVL